MLVKSEPVRRLVVAALNTRTTEVLLWGWRHAPDLKCRLVTVRHCPSAAAHVFKPHALAAGTAFSAAAEGFYSAT